MTTREKMLSGEYYISWDEDLTRERERAKDSCFEFNNIKPSLREEREEVIRKLFGKAGKIAGLNHLSIVITEEDRLDEFKLL